MLKKGKTIVVNASSNVNVGIDGAEKIIATMNANVDESGGISQNSYINSREDYLKYKEEVDKDLAEFNTYVNSLMEV